MGDPRRIPVISWLFPRAGEPGAAIARRVRVVLTVALTIANVIGAAVVFGFLGFVLPTPAVDGRPLLVNVIVAVAYVGTGTVVGTVWGTKWLRPVESWLRSDEPASEEQRVQVLRSPNRIAAVHGVLWSAAGALFWILNAAAYDPELGSRVGVTVLLGGLTTCAVAYLMTERIYRPVAARALSEGVSERYAGPGVRGRAVLAWVLGTGIPLIGIVMVALSALVEEDFTRDDLAATALALAGIALVLGLYVSTFAARGVADPVREVSRAMAKVEAGELDVEVPVYDGSEAGLLQTGFNRMVAGLRERERIHDLFGRHVGEEVAREALSQEVELGGEVKEVTVLFVDLVGSTALAAERPPDEVVEILNRFFAVVVDVVREHGGWINKFEGDAALAVFGAPVPVPEHADSGLACARELHRRLGEEADDVEAGIGVSSGEVVAGNIGEESRFEYTVIGDPVNEAARLTELAKTRGGVLASGAAVDAAGEDEAGCWETGEEVELRGRSTATRLATPRDAQAARSKR